VLLDVQPYRVELTFHSSGLMAKAICACVGLQLKTRSRWNNINELQLH
jgi:hypothetical protein